MVGLARGVPVEYDGFERFDKKPRTMRRHHAGLDSRAGNRWGISCRLVRSTPPVGGVFRSLAHFDRQNRHNLAFIAWFRAESVAWALIESHICDVSAQPRPLRDPAAETSPSRGRSFFGVIQTRVGRLRYRLVSRPEGASDGWRGREIDLGFVDMVEGARQRGLCVDRDGFGDGLVVIPGVAESGQVIV